MQMFVCLSGWFKFVFWAQIKVSGVSLMSLGSLGLLRRKVNVEVEHFPSFTFKLFCGIFMHVAM